MLGLAPDLAEVRYGDPARLVAEMLDAFLPAERISIADYAAENRYLFNEGGGYVGRWSHEIAPYLVAPMQAPLTERLYSTVAVVGPGQCGKTEIPQNWLLHSVATNVANFLWYMQTDDGVSAFVKNRIDPMVRSHAAMTERLGLRPVDDSLHFKRFRGMTVEFLSAVMSNLINKNAPRIVADEVDAYQETLGDIKALLDIRRQAFGAESKLLMISHPDLATGHDPKRWTAGIMAAYADSDRRMWYWPCPECGAWSSPCPLGHRVMTIDYPEDAALDEIEDKARLICPVNGCVIDDRQRGAMNLAAYHSSFGGWVGDGQILHEDGTIEGELARRDTAGFWIVGAMSPFTFGGIGGLARARVKAEREFAAGGEEKSLRTVMSKQWGVPYQPRRAQHGRIDADTLAARADATLILGRVPEGVRFLVAAVDCQGNRFEALVRGFGVGGQSWVIAREAWPADPATSPEDWDRLVLTLARRRFPLADGSGRMMALRALGYDMHGAPGVTQQAYAAWLRWRRAKQIDRLGRAAGREIWTILPLRGVGTPNASRLTVTYPDTSMLKGRRASRGQVPVGQFSANSFKDDLAGQLARAEPGSWYVNFPATLRGHAATVEGAPRRLGEPPHEFFEQLTAERRLDSGRWEKLVESAANEALDLMVMTHVMAHLHGLPRIDWRYAPNWAAEWDKNALVFDAKSPPPLTNVSEVARSEPQVSLGNGRRAPLSQVEGGARPVAPANGMRSIGSVLP